MRSSESANRAVMAIWLASCRYAGVSTKGSSAASQKAISMRRQRTCASRYRCGSATAGSAVVMRAALPEQARRPPHQQADHDEIYEECSKPGKVVFARHVADAQHRRGEERAADRAEPADRHHDEDVDEVGKRERGIEADDLDCERSAEAREPAAQREGDHEGPVDVDSEAARHALVVHGG